MQTDQLKRVRQLLAHYQNGDIPTLAQHEVNPGFEKSSRENYLYFTLPVCINFQRNSPAMWASALKTWEDPTTRYLFYPEKLAETKYEKIQADLGKHRLGLQPNKHTLIWTTITSTLHNEFKDDPREIIKLADNNVLQLLDILQVSHKPSFPYLSGPKLSNYWPYILSQYTDVTWQDPHEISIIPDTHVIKSSIHLGLVQNTANQAVVVQAWRDLLKGSDINPVQMHPVLWNWSRAGFNPSV